ncbi:unnamed protein product [Lactuca virosa]|uniref:Uncharacterized protein n=1 Tax=Lactuca virosa TaxID=75947 RepID=A0AAU9MGI4_9ASTR|nr:unnamed protein product [Lactuca virosa]
MCPQAPPKSPYPMSSPPANTSSLRLRSLNYFDSCFKLLLYAYRAHRHRHHFFHLEEPARVYAYHRSSDTSSLIVPSRLHDQIFLTTMEGIFDY